MHVHSWFSFLSGGSSPERLAARAAELGMGALALTDLNGVYGVVRFQKACRAAGIRPIIGAEVQVVSSPEILAGNNGAEIPPGNIAPLVLIARSKDGYANLCRLLTTAHHTSREQPYITLEQLADTSSDLICLTSGRDGMLFRTVARGGYDDARLWLARLRDVFDDRLYVELSHHLRPLDASLVRKLHEIATRERLPVVAAGDVRYATPEDYRRYDLLTCIRLGWTVFDPHPERPVNAEAYLKSEEQLRRLIPFPEAFENTEAIAASCSVDLLPGYVTPPKATLPDQESAADHLVTLCLDALPGRYRPERQMQALKQARKELGVITDLGLEEYFLVVREVVAEAKRRGIRCAGRGSAANSIVAYLLGITGVDPIEHNLLFERFLHGGRKGTPDIDVDFDSERREDVIAWMEERFGMEQTAMTANVVSYRLRMALRDVAKALGWPLPVIDKLTAAAPHRSARGVRNYRASLVEVLGESPLFETLLDMVESLDECPRHLGLHSGGMLLSRRPLYHYTPVQVSANGVGVCQFDKNDVEAMGLIKLDILGLRMLAAISEAVELVERHEGIVLDIDGLPLDDAATFEMIRSGRTLGTFQIESQGQMHLLAKHQPECFNDLIAEIALFRPGPLQGGMVNPFIRRRRGEEPVEYAHPDLEPVLRDTYGVILFQEQVLEVAHHFAGMTLAEADDFRALMSKFRDPGEMEGMREKFVAGTTRRGVDVALANAIFDKLANFVGYGFCRSHAAAFAKTVYQSCWLKTHHPAAYMAAIMQHRPGMYSLMTLEEEARRFGVEILLPDINCSGVRYEVDCGLRVAECGLEEAAKGGWSDGATERRSEGRREGEMGGQGEGARVCAEPDGNGAHQKGATDQFHLRPSIPSYRLLPIPPSPLPPTLFQSATRNPQPAIRKPLTSIKGLTAETAHAIYMERLQGPFTSVEDLMRRVDLDRDNLEALARSGALDTIAGSSRRALWEVGVLARRLSRDEGGGMRDESEVTPPSRRLFKDEGGRPRASRIIKDESESDPPSFPEEGAREGSLLNPQSTIHNPQLFELPAITPADIPELPALSRAERLSWDYQTHGAARHHPMILLRRTMQDLEIRPISTCYGFSETTLRPASSPKPVLTIAGLATLRQMPPTASGVMFVTLEDESGFIQCIVLPKVQEKYPALFRGAALIVRGKLEMHGNWRGLLVERAWPLDNALGGYEGYASAYGGTDRLRVDVDENRAIAAEYARDLAREAEALREEIRGRERVDVTRR